MANTRKTQKLNDIIRTDKFCLRLLSPSDVTAKYVRWMNDEEVVKFIADKEKNNTKEKLKHYVRLMHESPYNYMFGIFLNQTQEHIGNIKIGSINPQHLHADIGILIGEKQYWGKNHGTLALKAVTNYAFDTLKLNTVFATIKSVNRGSFTAFLKAGYQHVGTLHQYIFYKNKFIDLLFVEKINQKIT